MGTGGLPGVPKSWGVRPPPSWPGCGSPLVLLPLNIFLYSKISLPKLSGLLELCRIGLSDLHPFWSRIPAAGILPLHVNLVK